MYLGIDLGTSAIKLVLLSATLEQLGSASVPLESSSPQAYWSEQDAGCWLATLAQAMSKLCSALDCDVIPAKAIGLSGQMHGAVILNQHRQLLRPVILWNDNRSFQQSTQLQAALPNIGVLSGIPALPGFTAPKLLWLKKHEPEIHAQIAHILLPKDYLGLLLHGNLATDYSDASGTLWLEQPARIWSKQICALTATDPAWLPQLHESTAVAGILLPDIAQCLHLPAGLPIACGGGDAATGAVSVGAIKPGACFISLGTSGQLVTITDKFRPNPQQMVHALSHCVPATWYQMMAMLNGARPLSWFAEISGLDIATLLSQAQQASVARVPTFLPYLTGERSPHGDPHIRGAFYNLEDNTDRGAMMRAVVEAIAFCYCDAVDTLTATGSSIESPFAIGGGSKSDFLLQTIANATNLTIKRGASSHAGPAYGAAQLAAVCVGDLSIFDLAVTATITSEFIPDATHHEQLATNLEKFRRLYRTLKPFNQSTKPVAN